MKCLKVVFAYCALHAFVVAGNKDDHKSNHRYQEKSHINKHAHEKSHGSHHVLDRHKKTEGRLHSSSHFQHLAYRDGNQKCPVVCNNGSAPNITGLTVLYNGSAETGLLAFVNQSSLIAVIQDYLYNVTVFLNGKSGSTIVSDNTKQTFYYSSGNINESIPWNASQVDFTTYFKNIVNLQKQLKLGEEHGKHLNGLPEIATIVHSDWDSVGFKPSEEEYTIYINFISQLNGTLKFIFKGQGSFVMQKGITWFAKLNLAFANIFTEADSKELQSADLKLNLSLIYGADTSNIKAFVSLLAQIGSHLDLCKICCNGIRSPEKLLEWLRQITGGSNEGEDGIINVIITVLSALNGHASLSQVIDVAANYKPGSSKATVAQVIDEFLDLIEAQGRQFNNSEAFREIVTVLKALNNNNYVYKNVNISDIITLFTSINPVTSLQTLIRIFSRLFSVEGFVHYIQDFLANINNPNSLGPICRLFPGLAPRDIVHFIQSILTRIPFLGNFLNSTGLANGLNISNIVDSNPISEVLKNVTGHSPVGTAVDGFRNATLGIVNGVQNAVQSFLGGFGGFLGSENNGSSTSAPSAATSAAKNTEVPKTSSSVSEASSTAATSHASGVSTPKPEESPTASAKPEKVNSSSPVTAASTGSGSQAPILRKGYVHRVHEKKNDHTLHAANRNQHGNLKHNLHEKNNHHKLHELNRHQNIHYKHKLHEKDNHYN